MKILGTGLALAALLFASPAFAEPHIAELSLGMKRDAPQIRALGECPSGGSDAVCGPLLFGEKSWQGTLNFRGDVLDSIALSAPLSDDMIEAAFKGFEESPYVVYGALTEKSCFDFLAKAQENLTPAEVDAAFAAFLEAIQSEEHATATYFYTDRANYEAAKASAPGNGGACGPKAFDGLPSSVACCLVIREKDVTILIMPWTEWQKEFAVKTFFGA